MSPPSSTLPSREMAYWIAADSVPTAASAVAPKRDAGDENVEAGNAAAQLPERQFQAERQREFGTARPGFRSNRRHATLSRSLGERTMRPSSMLMTRPQRAANR